MKSPKKKDIPQAGCNPATGSDRVRAPVAGAGSTDSGGSQSFAEEEQVFKPRRTMMRSPMKLQVRCGSVSDAERIMDRVERRKKEEEGKRKRSEGEEERKSVEIKEKKELVTIMREKAEALYGLIQDNVFKTVEIEDSMAELRDIAKQVEAERIIEREAGKLGEKTRMIRKVCGMIERVEGYGGFEGIESMEWPEECFKRTRVKVGNFPTNEGDIVFLRKEEGFGGIDVVNKRMNEFVPEVMEVKEEGWETLIMNTRRISQTQGAVVWERHVHVSEDRSGGELYSRLEELKERMTEMGRKKGALPLDGARENACRVAKMVECVFGNTDICFDIYEVEGKERSRNRTFQNSAVLVKGQGSYADTLKKVKEVFGKEEGTGLRKVRSTRNGELLLEMGDNAQCGRVEEIIKKIEGVEAKVLDGSRGNRKIYKMWDLDALTTEEEIIRGVRKEATNEKERNKIRVVALREGEGDTKVAIIEAAEETVKAVLSRHENTLDNFSRLSSKRLSSNFYSEYAQLLSMS